MNPIQEAMQTTMSEIKNMIDVSTVVGKAVTTQDNTIIIPVSKVSTGFMTGGGEYTLKNQETKLPYAAGGGAGITISPVGFVVVKDGKCDVATIDKNTSFLDKIIDKIPDIMDMMQKLNEKAEK